MTDILMPKLSDSMEQGTILSWLKSTGEQVEVGDELLEIETDKSTVTYVAEDAGMPGDPRRGREPRRGRANRSPGSATSSRAPLAEPTSAPGEPDGRRTVGRGLGCLRARRSRAARGCEPVAAPLRPTAATGRQPLRWRDESRPLHGVELDDVARNRAAGPDHPRATSSGAPASAPTRTGTARAARAPTAATSAVRYAAHAQRRLRRRPPGSTRQELSRLQQLIARRMADAKATVPHFQVQTEVVMDAAIALRGRAEGAAGETRRRPVAQRHHHQGRRASLCAITRSPTAPIRTTRFELHDAINVGIAVAADERARRADRVRRRRQVARPDRARDP